MKFSALTLTAVMALSGAAHAATVTYDEAIEGDAGASFGAAAVIGNIAAGDDLDIIGSTNDPAGDSRDTFSFTTASDFTFNVDSFTNSAGLSAIQLFDGSNTLVSGGQFASGSTGAILGSGLFSAGSYSFRFTEGSNNVVADYSVSIDTVGGIAPVPLPAGLPLLIGGLGVLGWMRRRQQA